LIAARFGSILFLSWSLPKDSVATIARGLRLTLQKRVANVELLGPTRRGRRKDVPVKIESVFLFAMAIGACPLAAQYTHIPTMQASGVARVQTAVIVSPPALSHCPVSMRAKHLSDGSMVQTGKPAHSAGVGQRLHLTLRDAKQIQSATLTIHGLTPKAHSIMLWPGQGGSPGITRDMSVKFLTGSDGSASADLWIPGMSAVESIELESLIYSDGSAWKVTDGNACRITPDPFMLISGR
jgi:hypothetical protein